MAKKKGGAKKSSSNVIFTVIGMVVAALILVTLALNIFHDVSYSITGYLEDTHKYYNGIAFIGSMFGEGADTSFVNIVCVISYLVTLLISLAYIVLAALKLAGVKLNGKMVKFVSYAAVITALIFIIFAFIRAGQYQDNLHPVLGDKRYGKYVVSIGGYLVMVFALGNAIVSSLEK